MKIEIKNVTKTYPRKSGEANFFYAVKETSFNISEGSLSVILGRSGSGKSTLLNMIGGLLKPTSGEILYDNKNIFDFNDKELSVFRNKNIGMIPQVQSVLPNLTVFENVMLPYALYKKENTVGEYADELLKMTGIFDLKNVYASDLSGGEMRRVAIARALINKPSIILGDEPTADLDEENTEKVFEIFKKTAQQGTTVLLVTHETDAKKYADCVYKMQSGELSKET